MIKKQIVKSSSQVKLTFVQPYDESKPRTFVVGDFNDWTPAINPLVKRSNGTASASITVKAGECVRFRYYTEDGAWFNDEAADSYEPGEFGEDNSVVVA
ncbi:MAG: isoamylase early set domain-containing protein [Caldilineaceae bacterium]